MEPEAPRSAAPPARAALAAALRHPVVTGVLVVTTLAGAAFGAALLTGEWSLAHRLAAGAVAGAGTGLLLTATKMLG